MKRYTVTSKTIEAKATLNNVPIAKEIIAVLRSHNLNYEDAKKALDCTDQVLLNYLLKDKKI